MSRERKIHDLIARQLILVIGLDNEIAQQLAQKGVLRALFNMKLEDLFFRPFCDVQQIMESKDLDDYYTMIGSWMVLHVMLIF
ncbi:hypothetical protein BHYA_0429g00030 [Botrytis hyacinthi]|uniref:Uncharacterized protein n=1 Tax=Botrytis hyacinthi TaxID=278943 RepID=A0A4Z1G8C4_9HELO|nr:hypothetical protein BHYA_0429g00030 [Botrytis hyacinthi]